METCERAHECSVNTTAQAELVRRFKTYCDVRDIRGYYRESSLLLQTVEEIDFLEVDGCDVIVGKRKLVVRYKISG